MAPLAELFDQAVQAQQRGDLPQAERLYRQILKADPTSAKVHAKLGEVLQASGRWQEAYSCFQEAIRLNPSHADAHNNLGMILVVQGRLAEANACFRQALRINPSDANAHYNLGVILREQGQTAEAARCFQQALLLNPNHAYAHTNLGLVFMENGQPAEAALCHRRALQIQPDRADAHYHLGNALFMQGQLAEAAECFEQDLGRNPNHAEGHYNLGKALHDLGRPAEAVRSYEQALRLNPNYVEGYNNLANALRDVGKITEAIACYGQALRLNPKLAITHNNLGNAFREQGRLDEAAACYLEALRLKPDYEEAHVNLGMLRILQGDYEAGWPEYEWRFRLKRLTFRPYSQPRWDGAPLDGKTILLQAEQGFGDTLQFIRFAPYVKQQGGTVLLECPVELVRILQSCAGIDQIKPSGGSMPPFDLRIPLLSLPLILKTTLATVPACIPYLQADAALTERWRREIARLSSMNSEPTVKGDSFPRVGSGFNIGIFWQGSPRFAQLDCRIADQRRSLPLAQFKPLARVPSVRLFSLQKGYGTEQLAEWKDRWGIVELGNKLDDFMDTAAVMMNLDLIISVDTAPAHLAGALGRPVWIVLPFVGCWRWLVDREDSPWYPTARLFRQHKPGDWTEVFERVAEEVKRALAGGPEK